MKERLQRQSRAVSRGTSVCAHHSQPGPGAQLQSQGEGLIPVLLVKLFLFLPNSRTLPLSPEPREACSPVYRYFPTLQIRKQAHAPQKVK